MRRISRLLLITIAISAVVAMATFWLVKMHNPPPPSRDVANAAYSSTQQERRMKINLTPEQIAAAKERLTPEQYKVCFLRGTEPPGSGKYEKLFEPGSYHCAVCGTLLFPSNTKYDSHSGWPAFWDTASPDVLECLTDYDLGHPRTEVRCRKCGAHLGHVFEDGPKPTGLRYCINSLALEFMPGATDATATQRDK